jgi:hypothetical protein
MSEIVLPDVGISAMLMGPSGSGKSTFARNCLKALGSGLVILAPGVDELASYEEFIGNEAYELIPVDNLKKLDGFLRTAAGAAGELKHACLVFDTISGLDQVIRQSKLKDMGLTDPPKARSDKGGEFYQGLQYAWERFMHRARVMRGRGAHVIGLCHTKMRPVTDTTMTGTGLEPEEIPQPMLVGSARDFVPAAFDLVLHTSVVNDGGTPGYMAQWASDKNKVTKSRFGPLHEKQKHIRLPDGPEAWGNIRDAIEAAKEARRE